MRASWRLVYVVCTLVQHRTNLRRFNPRVSSKRREVIHEHNHAFCHVQCQNTTCLLMRGMFANRTPVISKSRGSTCQWWIRLASRLGLSVRRGRGRLAKNSGAPPLLLEVSPLSHFQDPSGTVELYGYSRAWSTNVPTCVEWIVAWCSCLGSRSHWPTGCVLLGAYAHIAQVTGRGKRPGSVSSTMISGALDLASYDVPLDNL